MKKPIIYIASAYTRGDPAINVHFQCGIFDQLLSDGLVWPVAPLWTYFQHMPLPRPYDDWTAYDRALFHLYDGCLRLDVEEPAIQYWQHESSGADSEVEAFKLMGKPVFYDISGLYAWVKTQDTETVT